MSRLEVWKDWNKRCLNHPLYKFLVLIGLAHSPSFEIHKSVIEKLSQYPSYEYTIRDEKPKRKRDVNWGWYAVYIIACVINGIVCSMNEFTIDTWQFWVYLSLLFSCFLSGCHYRNKEE